MKELLIEGLSHYLLQLQQKRNAVVSEMEVRASEQNFPIIGPLVGQLCLQMALSIKARDVFEMGSGFGYSTQFFAQAVGEQGRVVHTDNDENNSRDAKEYLRRTELINRVQFEVGDAIALLKKYPGPFDIIFIDIDKQDYPEALELARSRVRVGGYIITDNTLWSGDVLLPTAKQNAATKGVVRYNKNAFAADDLVTTIVPLRDGVALSLKVEEADPKKRR